MFPLLIIPNMYEAFPVFSASDSRLFSEPLL